MWPYDQNFEISSEDIFFFENPYHACVRDLTKFSSEQRITDICENLKIWKKEATQVNQKFSFKSINDILIETNLETSSNNKNLKKSFDKNNLKSNTNKTEKIIKKTTEKNLIEKKTDKKYNEKNTEKTNSEKRKLKSLKDNITEKCFYEKKIEKILSEKNLSKTYQEKKIEKSIQEKKLEKSIQEKKLEKSIQEKKLEKSLIESKLEKNKHKKLNVSYNDLTSQDLMSYVKSPKKIIGEKFFNKKDEFEEILKTNYEEDLKKRINSFDIYDSKKKKKTFKKKIQIIDLLDDDVSEKNFVEDKSLKNKNSEHLNMFTEIKMELQNEFNLETGLEDDLYDEGKEIIRELNKMCEELGY